MTISRLISRWGLLKTFAVSSVITILIVMSLSGFSLFNYLKQSLLHHDVKISADLIQSISSFSNLESYFSGISKPANKVDLIHFFERVMEIPDVYRVVVYDRNYRIIWSSDKKLLGKVFSDNDELKRTFSGEYVYEEILDVDYKKEHIYLPKNIKHFVESYIPVWDKNHKKVIGVIELYKFPEGMYAMINKGRILVILFSLLSGITLYGILFWVVKTAHTIIESQRKRIKLATSQVAEISEKYIRRIGAELHDGPTQSISFAVLKLDQVMDAMVDSKLQEHRQMVLNIQSALQDSLGEIRDISAGLIIPDLSCLSIKRALEKVIEKHQLRTDTKVAYSLDSLPSTLDMSIKICLYRFIQEGLNNAYKHGKGIDQTVVASQKKNRLYLQVSDSGPGIQVTDWSENKSIEHLGLRGLHERVESLGGKFMLSANHFDIGVKITCSLPVN